MKHREYIYELYTPYDELR